MCRTNANFKSFLTDPSVPKKKKAESIIGLMTDLKYTDTTKHLFGTHPLLYRTPFRRFAKQLVFTFFLFAAGVMASNGRLPETERVAKLFSEIMMASKGEVPAAVTSAEVNPTTTLWSCPRFVVRET
eukprot:1182937-Prorocentrum_minimum.AAC.9